MTQKEIIDLLESMASSWRDQPHLSNEGRESIVYHELKKDLEDEHGLTVNIIADRHATDYQLKFE